MSIIEARCYATRLLNPFQGVAQVVETEQARAISTDGSNWRLQIRSEIYKTPWNTLAIPAHYDRFFVYGVWSHQEGLARVPIHPSLYQDHVAQAAQDLLVQVSRACQQLPFRLCDNFELWLMDAAGQEPIALIASHIDETEIPARKQLHWYPAENTDTPFTSSAFAEDQAHATIKSRPQDLLHRVIKHRCKLPFQALWFERHEDGSGCVLSNHSGKTTRHNEILAAERFPPCLLEEHWQAPQAQLLINDYLNWQAPFLLMLPLSSQRRRELEFQAQQRPLAVHTYHRLYPEVIDTTLLNKILVEAVMRKAATKS
jgi:hypothetical protein